jgi:glyoxylase-like metal-dependent hydrolase (beta-lactamase superfamily II)
MDVNAYLFKGKTGYILIDAGSDKKNLSKELDKLEIKAKKISAVFLTRTVEDHYGSLGLFKNAVIYMSRDEELMIKGRTKHNNPIWKYGSYTLLNNNDSLNVDGLKIKILATPDNAPGSSDFVIGSGYLATGDNLVLKNRNPEQFSEKSNKNIPTDPANYKYVLTTHYGFVRE